MRTSGVDAAQYDRWYDAHRDVFVAELSLLLMVFRGGRGAELGAGTGRFGSAVGAEVLLDVDRGMLEVARGRAAELVVGDACHPPFRDGAFDYALMAFSLGFTGCSGLSEELMAPFRELYVLDMDPAETDEEYIRSVEALFGRLNFSVKGLLESARGMGLLVEGPVATQLNVDGRAVTVFAVRVFRPS